MKNDIGVSQSEFDKAMDAFADYEKAIYNHNAKVLSDNNIPIGDFKRLVDDCYVLGEIEIVKKPTGEDNCEDPDGVFKRVFVDQWSVGDSGDSYEGFIYGELQENKWLKIPYSC